MSYKGRGTFDNSKAANAWIEGSTQRLKPKGGISGRKSQFDFKDSWLHRVILLAPDDPIREVDFPKNSIINQVENSIPHIATVDEGENDFVPNHSQEWFKLGKWSFTEWHRKFSQQQFKVSI